MRFSGARSLLLMSSQFLFIDLILILPIAIFSILPTFHAQYDILLTSSSGMDWAISSTLQKESNGKSCVSGGLNSTSRPNCDLHIHSSCCISSRTKATLVSPTQSRSLLLAYHMRRYIPPELDRQKSSIQNSVNTSLFLVSCYEYILSGIVLSVGPPFRQAMSHNCKYSCFQN